MAADKPLNWGLCPAVQPLPGFDGAPAPDHKAAEMRPQLPTDIEGDQLSGTSTTPQYQGHVALKRGDQFLGADNLRMDTETGNYIAEGNVRYQDTAFRMVADRAEGNQDTDSHKVTNIQYQLVERRGNGAAESVDLQGDIGQMHRSTYTTCDPSQPIWRVRAPEIDVDNEEGFATARNAVLQIGKWPVLYFPWFKFAIDDRRQTGLLFPQFGLSGRNGFDYLQPIYLNLAPNYDATLLPRYMSKRGFMFGTEFRYLYDGGRGEMTGNYLPNDKLRDKDRGSVFYSGYHNVNQYWQARSSIAWVSDTRYMEDFNSRINGMGSASSLQSTAGIYGTGETWTAGLMADRWQLTDYTLEKQALPYNRQPRAYFTWNKPLGIFEAGVYAEAVRFTHDDSYLVERVPSTSGESNHRNDEDEYVRRNIRDKQYGSGARLDVKPYLSMPLSGAAWFVTPTVAWRYTAYQLDSTLANTAPLTGNRTPTRSLPIASVDAGLYFDRQTSLFGTNYLNTLEPRMYYLYVPYRDQNDLPVFDTRPFTFSYGQLFRDTRYTGADRQNDANQLTLAVTSRWLRQDDGREKLSLSVGQILYFSDSLVTINNSTNSAAGSEQTIDQGKSAWVADANYMMNDRWSMGATYQWNPNSRKEDLASVRTRYLLNDDGIINLAYRYRRNLIDNSDQLKQADFSFLYPINPSWSAVGRYYYSLLDRKPLEIIGGVQWDSCCLAVRGLVRRFVRNRDGKMDNSIQIEFVLKGLSSFGQNTDRTLRRAILGYYRDDLYLVPPSNTTTNPGDDDPNLIP